MLQTLPFLINELESAPTANSNWQLHLDFRCGLALSVPKYVPMAYRLRNAVAVWTSDLFANFGYVAHSTFHLLTPYRPLYMF